MIFGILATFSRRAGLNEGDENSDVALMAAFRDGKEDAFVQLYHRHRDKIVAYTTRMMGSAALGEEAAQDVFIKLYGAKDRYDPRAKFTTYLYSIATRHCLNLRAKHEFKKTVAGLDTEREVSSSRADAEAERGELVSRLRRALAGLPEKQAAAMVLVHYQGLSYAEASKALDTSESSIKSLVHRARGALGAALARDEQQLEGVPS